MVLAAVPAAADVVLVCPQAWRPALAPWLSYRESQGHRFAHVDAAGTPEQIQAGIRTAAREGELRFVLLVGDAEPALGFDPAVRARCVPTHLASSKVGVRWGAEAEIATDNWYADLDDDQVPDVALGRLTADSPAELAAMMRKIAAFEQSADDDSWRRRVNLVAGLGGFGALADAALEAVAKSILTQGIPAAYATTMTYASWQSPYCPHPSRFHRATLSRLNEGCLFWVYIGHGQQTAVDRVRAPDGQHHIFGVADVPRLNSGAAPPIALFLSCHSGAFDADEDCLAEHMLRASGGPVAVICGSRMTMPYGMCTLGHELLSECFRGRRQTLGEVLLHAKRKLVLGARDDDQSRALDALATWLSPLDTSLADERSEHVLLFNLLGDPLLRLPRPLDARLEVAATATAGGRLKVTGTSPIEGEAIVELVVRRDRLAFQPPARSAYTASAAGCDEYQETYQRANDPRLDSRRVRVTGGRFEVELKVPAGAWGPCHVRLFVQGQGDFAAAAADVAVQRSAGPRMANRKSAAAARK